MKKIILLCALALTGCATNPNQGMIRFADESTKKPMYSKDTVECDRIAKTGKASTVNNAATGAAMGAGIAALIGLAAGVDIGRMAAVGAASGGLGGGLGAYAHNNQDYRYTFLLCMRDRGYQAY
jgi:hypothetical protein